ncbi:MAG: histidine kinase dimerization/phospho-acceptor domain-containing protein, partial [Runella sp.]
DDNRLHNLYNEKLLIFNKNQELIYSSLNDALVRYDLDDLKIIKEKKRLFRQEKEKDLLGLYVVTPEDAYYVILTAEDKYGFSKLQYLSYTLWGVFLVGSLLVAIITYVLVERLLRPLDNFQKTIAEITVQELNTQLPQSPHNDEISLLSQSFNQMLRRIEQAYVAQKEFTANASHELRTPISRLITQLDNLSQQPHSEVFKGYLQNMNNDLNQMADLVSSLLLLARLSQRDFAKGLQNERIDEIIFSAYETVHKQYTDFQINFEIVENEDTDPELEIKALRSLLEIVFVNLFKNAYLYSDNRQLHVQIRQTNPHSPIEVWLTNTGQPIETNSDLFGAFVRGSNAQHISGSGLGLRIVKRILDFHQASISYEFAHPNLHRFVVRF